LLAPLRSAVSFVKSKHARGVGKLDWGLVTVYLNTESKVKSSLTRDAIPHHIFRHKETVIRRGRKVDLAVLTFPRYVFLQSDDVWHVSNLLDEVIAPVCFAGTVALLPPGQVEDMVASCVDGEDLLPYTSSPGSSPLVFMPGDEVEVVEGPMMGESGKYIRPSSPGRCMVELLFKLTTRKMVFDLAEVSLRAVSVLGQKKTKRKRTGNGRLRGADVQAK
jgi:transcription antitermination factor NusG